MRVADAIASWLAEKEITHAFGIIGGGNVVLWDAIASLGKTELVCVHHEQAAVMAAAYYQRASGRLAVALVTTGAGSTNAITGLMAAHMDGVPVLVISGNEASRYMNTPTRVWGVQGYDSARMAKFATVSSRRVKKPACALLDIDWARAAALAHRQGPAWLDIPKDIQSADA